MLRPSVLVRMPPVGGRHGLPSVHVSAPSTHVRRPWRRAAMPTGRRCPCLTSREARNAARRNGDRGSKRRTPRAATTPRLPSRGTEPKVQHVISTEPRHRRPPAAATLAAAQTLTESLVRPACASARRDRARATARTPPPRSRRKSTRSPENLIKWEAVLRPGAIRLSNRRRYSSSAAVTNVRRRSRDAVEPAGPPGSRRRGRQEGGTENCRASPAHIATVVGRTRGNRWVGRW